MTIHALTHQVSEWSYTSSKTYSNAFVDVELDVEITSSDGQSWRVPAFWAGGDVWKVRFSPPGDGAYTFTSVCSDTDNLTLHGQSGNLTSSAGDGHSLIAPTLMDGRLTGSDGEPFLWVGDTWWMGLSKRVSWPDGFKELTADRVKKGFTVIQMVAGLYPDMPALDSRCANEGGLPWLEDKSSINPAYFDAADLKISELARSNLVPCIVGCWGYYVEIFGIEKIKQHWRYIIARWGAYPVLYCLAGEGMMPYYLSTDKDRDRERQKSAWTDIARYVKSLDPYGRLITIHPTDIGRDQIEDDSLLDFNMLQTGHGGETIYNLMRLVEKEVVREPVMPVIVAEANYEGILHDSGPEHQRRQFWFSILDGAAGYTYGANGLWQASTPEAPYGASPHGASWGDAFWQEACRFAGSAHIGLAAGFLKTFDWAGMKPHPEWVTKNPDDSEEVPPMAAGKPGEFRLIYLYEPIMPWRDYRPRITEFEESARYNAYYWDPRTGSKHDLGYVNPEKDGSWEIPLAPTMTDWLLVLEAEGSATRS